MPRKQAGSRGSFPARSRKRSASAENATTRAVAAPEVVKEPNKGGRPTHLDDRDLLEQRDEMFLLLAERWGDVGWNLECAKTVEAVREAFRALVEGIPRKYWHQFFLLDAVEPASPADRRKTQAALRKKNEEIYTWNARAQREQERVKQSREARQVASDGNANSIREEHVARLRSRRAVRVQLRHLKKERTTLEELADSQGASIAQREVVKFIDKGKYPVTPRNVAFAIAGLPDVGWWQSFERCEKLEREHALVDSQQARIFDLVVAAWAPLMSKAELIESLRKQIEVLPARDCQQIAFRAYLAEHWRCLRLAVEDGEVGPPGTPHRVFSGFLARAHGTLSAEERFLMDRERLPFDPTDPEECLRIYRLKH